MLFRMRAGEWEKRMKEGRRTAAVLALGARSLPYVALGLQSPPPASRSGRPPGGDQATWWSGAGLGAPPRRAPVRLPWQRGGAWPKLTISQVTAAPTLPPALSPGGAFAPGGPGAHGHTRPLPAAPRAGSPALPKETPFTAGRPRRALGARGRGWGPRQAAENEGLGRRASQQTEAQPPPLITPTTKR